MRNSSGIRETRHRAKYGCPTALPGHAAADPGMDEEGVCVMVATAAKPLRYKAFIHAPVGAY